MLQALLDRAGEPWLLAAGVRDDSGRRVDFRLSYVNDSGCAALGMTRERIVGQTYRELWPAGVKAGLLDSYLAAVETGEPCSRRFHFDDDGIRGHFEVRVVGCGDGFAMRYANITDDVTRQARHDAERRLRTALDTSLDGFLMLSSLRKDSGRLHDLRVDYINQAGLSAVNRTAPDVLGAPMSEVFPGLEESGLLLEYLEVVETGTPLRREVEYTDTHVSSSFELQAVPLDDGLALSYRDTSAAAAQRRALEDGERSAREASQRATLLSEVAAALAETVTVAEVAEAIVTRVRSAVGADGVVVAVIDEDALQVIRTSGYDTAEPAHAEYHPVAAGHPLAVVADQREAAFVEDARQSPAKFVRAAEVPQVGAPHAVAFLPLIVSGRPIGSLAVSFVEPHSFSDEERRLLRTLAGQCAQALERARLFQREHDTAVSLQRALLPTELSPDPRVPVAARYLPAGSGVEIGGDFYDVISLPGGSLALVLGDVAGHNIAAAAVMGQVRNALRAYALDGHSPSGVMERTNRLLAAVEVERLTTCAYVEISPRQGAVTVVLAGHPPPVVESAGRPARLIDADPGPPLGVDPDTRYAEHTALVDPGSLVLLYSDGLVETRSASIDERIDRLVAAATGLPRDPEEACDRILAEVPVDHVGFDDVALLIARTSEATEGDGRITRTFPGDASSAPSARRFVADVLEAWQLPEVVDTAELVISELCTNAVLHTAEKFAVAVRREAIDLVRVEVRDTSDRVPQLRNSDDADIAGRGLHIVDLLAEEWGVEPAPRGKCVYATLRS